ncbi:MAG: hypothetical protein HDT21_00550 [Ruminococcus sp.]|nr:hypothetical protein [Ruminococcus sp.]
MKGKRLKSFSGTVLIMILTVMLVLIIMLMATLTVVTTASQRIYTKYEENQAYYSARSALDVFTQNLLYDRSYYAYPDSGTSPMSYTYGDGETADMKQGLALQLELYKIKTKDTADADVKKSIQNLLQTEFATYANDVSVTGKDEYVDYFGVVASGTTYESAVVYEVEFPTLTNGVDASKSSHNFGEMADKKKARITIEVLSREYDMGDDVLTSDPTTKVKDKIASFNGDEDDIKTFLSNAQNYKDVIKAVANGSRKKDKMRLKITATTMIRGVEGTAVLICNSNEPPINNSSRAITAFGGATGINHAYIVGGMSMIGDPANPTAPINWTNNGGIYGTVYCETGLNINVVTPIILTEGEYVFLGGDLISNNGSDIKAAVTDTSLDKRPFVYVNGDLNVTNKITIGGTGDEAVDVIVDGDFIFTSGSQFTCNGNVYITGNCTLTSTAGNPDITGNMYVGGDITAQNNCVNGNTIKTGTGCTIYTTAGATIIAGYDGDGNPVILTSATSEGGPGGSFNSSDVVIPDMADDMQNKTSTGKDKFEIKLPGSPSVTKKVETHKGNYDNYYYIDTDGNYTDSDGNASAAPVAKTAISLAGSDFTDATNIPSDELTDAVVTAGIDTGAGLAQYVVYDKNYGGKILRVTGGGTAELYLAYKTNPWWAPPTPTVSVENLKIIVDDDTTLKIFGATPNATYDFKGVQVWTTSMYEVKTNSDIDSDGIIPSSLNVGMTAGHGIKVPKIYYYFSGGTFNTQDIGGNSGFFAGYFFGPDTNIWSQKSSVTFDDMYYFSGESSSGAHVDTSWPFIFVGSILCKDYEFQNDQGVAYINPNLADDGNAGDPIHQWQAYQYTRN